MFEKAPIFLAASVVLCGFLAESCNNPDGRPPGRSLGGTGAVKGCTDGTGGVGQDASASGGAAGAGGGAGSGGSAAAAGASGAAGGGGIAGGSGDGGPAGASGAAGGADASAGGVTSSGGTTASGGKSSGAAGCAGAGAGGAAALDYGLVGCQFTQSCDQVISCESSTKLVTTAQADCSGSYDKAPCDPGQPLGACVKETGNQCTLVWPSSSFYTIDKAQSDCQADSGRFIEAGRCSVKMRCDGGKKLGTCVDYGAGYTESDIKTRCASGNFANSDGCEQKDTIGSCLIADEKHCATIWYSDEVFSFSQASDDCDARGGHFLFL